MNFKFENDIENNSMTVYINLPLRKRITEERKRVKFLDVLNIVKQNYSPPKTHTLGECTSNTAVKLDNDYKNSQVGQWTFSLIPKKAPTVKKTTTSRTRTTKRTRTAKKRSDQ